MNLSVSRLHRLLLLATVVLCGGARVHAQWRTETFDLVAGWQAIYLRVDTETALLNDIMTSFPKVEEVWRWRPKALDASILTSPSQPVTSTEWQVWKRDDRGNSNLSVFYGNSAYLVKVEDGAGPFTLSLKGRVGVPQIQWRTDGLNLLGFPTNPTTAPTVESFFSPAQILDQQTEIFGYIGGPLANNTNPARLDARFGTVKRGRAYWIRSNKYADYDGPLRVRAAIGEGIDFNSGRPTVRVVLTNRTDREMVATLTPQSSEAPPGSTSVPQAVPLTRRVEDGGEFVYESFASAVNVTLQPNETLGITLGIDRSKLTGAPGAQAYSLLKVTDSEGLSLFYVPAHAEVASLAGLWVGEAEITRVQNQLQRFQKDTDGSYLVGEDGHYIPEYKKDSEGVVLEDEQGNPIPDSDTELNSIAQVYRLKVILHVAANGSATLLSRAYVGVVGEDGQGAPVVGAALSQSSLLDEYLSSASRVSAVHLPKQTDLALGGSFAPSGQLTGTLVIAHDDPQNPFIHEYHPDHDNLDARFESPLPEGYESYRIDRTFVLTLDSEAGQITDPSWGTTLLTGVYSETFSGLHKNPIAVEGVFAIRRYTSTPQLLD